MTTVNEVAIEVVKQAIDLDYVKECGFKTVGETFQKEYGHTGLSDKSCREYLQGLPSVCSVPFYNSDILNLLESKGISRVSSDAQFTLIEQYWTACGHQLHLLIQRGE